MERLLTVCTIPVGNGDGFYSIIPKLAFLPPVNLFDSELCGFEGSGRIFDRPSTLRRMTIRVCADAAFICLRPLWFWGRGDILGYVWRTKPRRAAFTAPLSPFLWSSTFAIRLRCRGGASRPSYPFGGSPTTGSSRSPVSGVIVIVIFLLFVLISVLLEHEVQQNHCSTYQGTYLSASRIINVRIVGSCPLTRPCLT